MIATPFGKGHNTVQAHSTFMPTFNRLSPVSTMSISMYVRTVVPCHITRLFYSPQPLLARQIICNGNICLRDFKLIIAVKGGHPPTARACLVKCCKTKHTEGCLHDREMTRNSFFLDDHWNMTTNCLSCSKYTNAVSANKSGCSAIWNSPGQFLLVTFPIPRQPFLYTLQIL